MRTSIRLLTAAMTLCTLPAIAGEWRSREPDAVIEWNSIMVATSAAQNPFAQARTAAITQLAVFEAVNAIAADFDPYLGTIEAPRHASREAATIAAAHGVLRSLFPASAASLDAAREASLARLHPGRSRDEGLAVGAAAAAAMLVQRSQDGSVPPEFHRPLRLPRVNGRRRRAVRRLVEFSSIGATCSRSPSRIPRSFARRRPRSRACATRSASMSFGSSAAWTAHCRPQDRADVARFYAASPAVPVWNAAATQVAVARGDSLTENARTLALLNAAISDALASVMETKYYRFWRPETAIHAGDADGNVFTRGDASFAPLIVAPCFPAAVPPVPAPPAPRAKCSKPCTANACASSDSRMPHCRT